MKLLKVKQQKFFESLTTIQQIVVSERIKGLDHYKCYYATGFEGTKADAAAHSIRICNLPHIKKFIRDVIGACAMAEEAIAERKDVLKRLTGIMDANIFEILDFEFDSKGMPISVTVKNKKELDMVQQLAVKKIEPTETGMKVTLHDPIDAIKQLCKMQGYDAPTKKQITLEKLDDKMRDAVDAELEGEY